MRRTLLALIALTGTAWARIEVEGDLDPAQVVPPPLGAAATAAGRMRVTVENDGALRWELQVRDLSGFATATTLRRARAGEIGPIVATLTNPPPTGTHVGELAPLDAATLEALWAGSIYVEVATSSHPAGELRGQLALTVVPDVTCSCAGSSRPAFRRCVRRALRADRRLRRSATGERLARLARYAACGPAPRRVPRRSAACCVPWFPEENLVVERLCAQVSTRTCTRLDGWRLEGTSCLGGPPPCAAP
jgi:hypothetical protein